MNALASSQAPHHAPPCKHAVSFALLLVLSKPKHRFGFVRRNGGADVELSGLPGKRNGASPFGRYPLLHSSLPRRKSSLRLGDARRPYSAKAISSPASVAGGFQRGAHIPLWRAQVPNASLTCVWNRKKPGADMETARLRGGEMQRAASDARLHPVSFCTSRKKWGGIGRGTVWAPLTLRRPIAFSTCPS